MEVASLDDDYLMISALQHYAYCPRQFALIHIEQVWQDNQSTAEGNRLHQRVDSFEAEQRGPIRYERSVMLRSEQYRIRGKMDLLEVEKGESLHYLPVEYKRGKPKTEDWDKVQLCAQALCLEEMRSITITRGAIWYWEVRKREPVIIDCDLRKATVEIIESARRLLSMGQTPQPTDKPRRCLDCSLADLCQPKLFGRDWSDRYMDMID